MFKEYLFVKFIVVGESEVVLLDEFVFIVIEDVDA